MFPRDIVCLRNMSVNTLHKGDDDDNNNNGVRIVHLVTTIFAHLNIHKYTWNSPDGENHNQIAHILIDKSSHLNILYLRSFRVGDWDTDHCLGVAKDGKILVASVQTSQNSME